MHVDGNLAFIKVSRAVNAIFAKIAFINSRARARARVCVCVCVRSRR